MSSIFVKKNVPVLSICVCVDILEFNDLGGLYRSSVANLVAVVASKESSWKGFRILVYLVDSRFGHEHLFISVEILNWLRML